MGVPLSGPSYIHGDNMSVIHNTQRPESTLKKKNNSICYHDLREAVAMGEWLTTHIPTKDNLSDMMTKVLYGSKKTVSVEGLMYDVFDSQDPIDKESKTVLRKKQKLSGHQRILVSCFAVVFWDLTILIQ